MIELGMRLGPLIPPKMQLPFSSSSYSTILNLHSHPQISFRPLRITHVSPINTKHTFTHSLRIKLHPKSQPQTFRLRPENLSSAQIKNEGDKDDGFIVEDVPHLTDFLPDVPDIRGVTDSDKRMGSGWIYSRERNLIPSDLEAFQSYPSSLKKSAAYAIVKRTFVNLEDVVAQDAEFEVIGKPWTAETIIQVMLLSIVSFWFVGSWVIPFTTHIIGFSKKSLTYRGQALFSLLTDVSEGLAGILILQRCLSRFRPLPMDWFKFSIRGKWSLDVSLGCCMFPLVNRLSQFNLYLLPVLPSTPVTLSSVEQSIISRDPIAMALYALVLVVCAPLWEETVFRGFLLPSLTKYMPVWCTIVVSAIAFALAHFNVERMLPLIFLGIVMGVIYTRSRNLLPAMLLHSLWNAFVFLDLMK